MSGKFIASLLLFTLSITFMYRESTGQSKRTTTPTKPVPTAEAAPEIGFTVAMSKPSTHLLEVEMHLKWRESQKVVELKMPVWTPGSYLIREYARHVQDFKAVNPKGDPLRWQKINKNT